MKTQCKLQFEGGIQTAWIDSDAAKVGNMVEILEDGNFWTVKETYSSLSDKEVKVLSDRSRGTSVKR